MPDHIKGRKGEKEKVLNKEEESVRGSEKQRAVNV
jgi:hypothetical protein